ncbi:helix-turn-helix transcriptional regulator [Chitinophaga qingshengii]|uniref:Helix-turn-helix transcriptional regulator n=1 Tax=Chitinophaga qingshengii TaxID=1569794 RepID=A0ABR7TS33_9BACT|nr:helix-turn-helix transcriptional regulator [Chitinophaga qingshengii]MBC9932808.1 helix-turn-helix transcriptional regulator [Chitinophaga qingshengii]
MQFSPSALLAPYIKNYTLVTIDQDIDNEVFYPSGYIDLVIRISGTAATVINGNRQDTPAIELLGHLTLPSRVAATKGTVVLIARIYPYAGALFFPHPVSEFTNYATNLNDVSAVAGTELYSRLMEAGTIAQKISVLEGYLLQRLTQHEKQLKKVTLVQQLSHELLNGYPDVDLPALAGSSGLSARYIQKLYLTNMGISPVAFVAVVRFNRSLRLVLDTPASLTAIAYECGYYDQAHFIREFRKFTGITPSDARHSLTKNGEAYQQAVNIGF